MTDHLNERAREQLETLDDEARRDVMGEPRWLPYPAAVEAVVKIERLRRRQRSSRTEGVAVLGPFRNGKTMAADFFMGSETSQVRSSYYYQVPTEATRMEFLSGMIAAMGRVPDPSRRTIEGRRRQLEELLDECEPRVFIFDDAHHAFRGTAAKEIHTLIRTMGHRWDMSPVLIGDRTLADVIHLDGELRSRLDNALLRRWEYGREYAVLLNSLVRVLPLKRVSELTEAPLAQRIYTLSDGLVGEIVRIVSLAAALAVGGDERITLGLVDALRYVPLAKRFSAAELRGLA